MLPDRDIILDELLRLRDLGEGEDDLASRFLGGECRVALYALVQAHNALARSELLGGLYFLRLIAETTIRIRWIVGDGDDAADDHGYSYADGPTVRERVERMRKRDLLQLEAANRSIHDAGGTAPELAPQVRALADAIPFAPAPWDIRKMTTSPTARKTYAGHRLCSSLIHPGVALGRGDLMPRERAEAMVNEAAYLCSAWADAALRSIIGMGDTGVSPVGPRPRPGSPP